MKSNPTKTIKTLKFDPEIEPRETDEGPLIEIEFPENPDIIERPSIEHRKEEASKPLYLARYE